MHGTHPLVPEPNQHPDEVVLGPKDDNDGQLAHRHVTGAHGLRQRVRHEQPGVEHDRRVAGKNDGFADRESGADCLAQEGSKRGERCGHARHVRRDVLASAFASAGRRALAEEVGMRHVRVRDVCLRAPLLLRLVVV